MVGGGRHFKSKPLVATEMANRQNQQMKTNSVAAHASWVEVLLLGADNGFESGDRDGYAPPPTASTLPLDAPVLLSQ